MVTIPADDIPVVMGQLVLHFGTDAVVVESPGANSEEVAPTPGALRERSRYDAAGRYRPLPGAVTLPGGWHARFENLEAMTEAVEAVYPLAFEHLKAWDEGTLRVVGLDDVLERQGGRYAIADQLSPEGRESASRTLCGRCIKAPVWRGAMPAEGQIPCPEPCSVLVSLCREAAVWEAEPPAPGPVDPAVAFAAFEEPGNEVREAYLESRYG